MVTVTLPMTPTAPADVIPIFDLYLHCFAPLPHERSYVRVNFLRPRRRGFRSGSVILHVPCDAVPPINTV